MHFSVVQALHVLQHSVAQRLSGLQLTDYVLSCCPRTSVFGVVNPKRKPGTRQEVAPTALSGPLLSRFDMVLLLVDRKDAEADALIAAHILDAHQQGARGHQAVQVQSHTCLSSC